MPFGYHGCYLRIDVSTGADALRARAAVPDAVLRQYIGGSGLGARLLLDEGGATADPLSPEAPLDLRVQSARRQPSHDVREVRRRQSQSV